MKPIFQKLSAILIRSFNLCLKMDMGTDVILLSEMSHQLRKPKYLTCDQCSFRFARKQSIIGTNKHFTGEYLVPGVKHDGGRISL